MNEVKPRIVGPRGHDVGRREQTSRSPRKRISNPRASPSQRKKNKKIEVLNIPKSSLSERTRSAYGRGKVKITKLEDETLEPHPGDNVDNMEEHSGNPPEENPKNPREEHVEKPP